MIIATRCMLIIVEPAEPFQSAPLSNAKAWRLAGHPEQRWKAGQQHSCPDMRLTDPSTLVR